MDVISRQGFDKFLEDAEKEAVKNRKYVFASALNTIRGNLRYFPSAQPEQQRRRTFQEIVVEYPSISTYPEYEGKPYFSIKYTENGQEFIGYGTYKPEVLSEYLKEYFMTSAQPDSKDLVEKIKNGITASDGNSEYFIGLRNGMRWCLSLIDDKEPIYESATQHLDEWCTTCSEYDQERHCCPRWSRVIRQTLEDAQLRSNPCENCQEFDCYGCEWEAERRSDG